MKLNSLLKNQVSKWMEGEGPADDVVLSSRIRLARNIQQFNFPTRLQPDEARRLLDMLEGTVPNLRQNSEHLHDLALLRLDELTDLERRVLVEYHLISPQHARGTHGAAVMLNGTQSVSIMVNEEDHLRIQCLLPGMQLEEALRVANHVDDALEQHVDIAFDERWGYLTTCPTNTGTGLRASVMMHLPGLVLSKRIGSIITALAKVGVVVRGLYGEGSEPIGNVFQVSNQLTLGQSESDILRNLAGVCQQIIDRERSTREMLYQENRLLLEDRASRAYGLLTNARILSSDEAIRLLSDMRLGVDLNILPHVDKYVFNKLIVQTRPGYLQYIDGREKTAAERDVKRAAHIRQTIARSIKKSSNIKEA